MHYNIINELGELALGSRLKRLSDYIYREGKELYRNNEIEFEPRWFPVFHLLAKGEIVSVVEIADSINVSHAAVSQTVKELAKNKLVSVYSHKTDKRKRELTLTEKGFELHKKMAPLWNDIATALNDMIRQHKHHLMAAMQEVENDFETLSFVDRITKVKNERLQREVNILDYKSEYAHYFKALNIEWLEKYFYVEDYDKKVLGNPEKYIINAGGAILFAEFEGEIVGVCALLKYNEEEYELTKMAITEKAQGKQVGKKLGLAILERAKRLKAKKLVLESNKILKPALNLYERLGFKFVYKDFSTSAYQRANVYMEKEL
ncbi:MAG: bifunctional helix-turn-helix transcriptional regulator/GNAT family N-acetyltransferase [Cyclobacteriaceae bacterium]|nr:bifunctional helix-turn-helix transcriptional regulator/GNAT family N-acetyltransferase [Cyclobacteriaceae bacterium]